MSSISALSQMFGVSRIEVVSGEDLYSSVIFPSPPDPFCESRVRPNGFNFGAIVMWACSIFINELKIATVLPFSFFKNSSTNL